MTAANTTVPKGQLGPQSWIDAAAEVLAESGVGAVRVEPLARRLGVTKGSFYWHFKSREDLLDRLMQDWRKRATLAVIDRIESDFDTPQERLQDLLRLPVARAGSGQGARIELAMRIWGQTEPEIAAVLHEVDEIRLAYLAKLFRACAPETSDMQAARAKAVLAYSYLRVAPSLGTNAEKAALHDACMEQLLRLAQPG